MTSTQYYCAKVNNAGDSAYSNVVQIIIHPNTTIDSQSTFSQTQPYNGSFFPISVTASGAWSYQWYINTIQSLSGGTSLGSANGAQTNTYTPQANYDGERYYYCIVQGCQPNVTSQISDFFRVICPTPDNAAASNITSNSAVLSWNANGGTQWSIKYALGYFDPQTSGTIVTGVTNPFTLTGLAGGNSYYYYVQTNCGSNASTNWSGPYYFNTECGITSGAWSENFELGMLPPLCWYNYFFLEAMWFPTNACSSYGIGTTSIFANFFNQEYGASYYLSTFAFDISTLNQPKLKFDYAYAAYPFPGYEDDRLNVYYTTDFGFNWNLLTVMTGGSGGTLNTAGASYGPFTPNLSQWATQSISLPTGTNRIKFEAISGMGNNLYLDNIRVSGTLPSVKTINLHLFLEGLYNASTLSMNAVQDGNSGSAQWAPVIADKIDVELYNENAPYTAAGVSISGIDISTNGLASFQTDTSKNGNYYIKVSNRNHLATWSAIAVPFNGDTVYYDFTTNLFQAYGSNPQVQVGFSPDLFAFYLGDLDQGGWIDSDDFNMFEPDLTLGATGFYGSDFNGGGWVDSDDFNMFEPRITAGNATEYPGK